MKNLRENFIINPNNCTDMLLQNFWSCPYGTEKNQQIMAQMSKFYNFIFLWQILIIIFVQFDFVQIRILVTTVFSRIIFRALIFIAGENLRAIYKNEFPLLVTIF